MTQGLRILAGISGGIAAYKVPALVRLLRGRGASVKCVLTAAARSIVTEETLRTVSQNPVYSDNASSSYDMDHIRLAEWADALLIAPATANTIAKLSHGIADNLLSTLALSIDKPLYLAPAMNSVMWNKTVTQENLELLRSRGCIILPPSTGALACGTEGIGRMMDIEDIARQILALHLPRCFTGKHILISMGPTAEPIDPVRVISNLSSGKMGAALAQAALNMGGRVTVVCGPSAVRPPRACTCIPVQTAQEMKAAMEQHFPAADICIMAAAVSDYRVAAPSPVKIRSSQKATITLDLVQNPDILAGLGKSKEARFLAGFSLQTDDVLETSLQKCREKNCDLMIFNRADTALGTDTSRVTLLDSQGVIEQTESMDKSRLAQAVLLRIARMTGCIND